MEKQSEVSTEKVLKTTARKTAEAASLLGVTFLAHPERMFGANDRVRVARTCDLQVRGFSCELSDPQTFTTKVSATACSK